MSSTRSPRFYYYFLFYLLLVHMYQASRRDFGILRNTPEKALYIANPKGEISHTKASFDVANISGESYCIEENSEYLLVFEVRYTDARHPMLVYTSSDFQRSKTLKKGDLFVSNTDQMILYRREFYSFDKRLCYKPVSICYDAINRVFEFTSREPNHKLDLVNSDLAQKRFFIHLSEYPFEYVDFETLSALNKEFYESLNTLFKQKQPELQKEIVQTVFYVNPSEQAIMSKAQSLKQKVQTFCEEREDHESKFILSNI